MELITKAAFHQALQNESSPLFVACLEEETSGEQEQVLREAARQMHHRMRFSICRRNEHDWFLREFNIVGTPTYLVFSQGDEQGRMLGKADLDSLLGFIDKFFQKPDNLSDHQSSQADS